MHSLLLGDDTRVWPPIIEELRLLNEKELKLNLSRPWSWECGRAHTGERLKRETGAAGKKPRSGRKAIVRGGEGASTTSTNSKSKNKREGEATSKTDHQSGNTALRICPLINNPLLGCSRGRLYLCARRHSHKSIQETALVSML